MGVRCFVCPTGGKTDRKKRKEAGQKSLSLFSPPRDPVLFEEWKRIIPSCDKEFTRDDRICELHFAEDDIERYYVTNLPDGTVDKIERGKRGLKLGALPHFPDLPEHLSTEATNMKEFITHNSDDLTNMIKKKVPCHDEHNYTNNFLGSQDENVTRNCKIVAESITVPNEWWGISTTPKFIICSKWAPTFSPEKRVVIGNDLSVKVFIKDHEIHSDEIPNSTSSVEDISKLLQQVDSYLICAGIGDKSMPSCMKYIKRYGTNGTILGRFTPFCKACRIVKRQKDGILWRRKTREIVKFRKAHCFSCVLRKTHHQKHIAYSSDPPFTEENSSSANKGNTIVVAECLIGGDGCK